MHAKKLLAHKFDPFPAVTLSEFCLFAPAYPAHDFTQHTPRRHKKTGHCDRFVAQVFGSVGFTLVRCFF
ncbi:hypothetical protein E0U60_03430 [Salmonella enterica subsp. enterica serovar Tees]|nr:hypothetical protein [Salmonella enterica subsp. enterica serovar Tees]ECB6714707.1 hypothetical protein [Salmonella enterica subsp. enterica serovar Tees]